MSEMSHPPGKVNVEFEQYLQKVNDEQTPHFICDIDNHANLPLIERTIQLGYDRVAALFEPVKEADQGLPAAAPVASVVEALVTQSPAPTGAEKYTARLPFVSEVWNGEDPANYYTQIHVGDSDVPFFVILDTGSANLWLQSTVGGGQPLLDQSMYKSPLGTSSTPDDSVDEITVVYGDRDKVRMQIFKDCVRTDSLVARNQAVGAAFVERAPASIQETRTNGLLGLGRPLDPADSAEKNLAQTLYEEGKIKYPSFSFIGPRNDLALARQADRDKTWQQPRGEFVIGALPEETHEGEIVWCKVAKQYPLRWIVRLNKVLVNGQELVTDQWALIDSGTSYIVTSSENCAALNSAIHARQAVMKGKPSNSLFAFQEQALQSMAFEFGPEEPQPGEGAARSFELRREDLSLGRDDNDMCVSSVSGYEADQFPENYWILGGIFMDNQIIVLNFAEDGRRIGFATLRDL